MARAAEVLRDAKGIAKKAFAKFLNGHCVPHDRAMAVPPVQHRTADIVRCKCIEATSGVPTPRKKVEMDVYDVVDEARQAIDSYLSLLAAISEAWEAHSRGSGRFICLCRDCRRERHRTSLWLIAMRAAPRPPGQSPAMSASQHLSIFHYG